MDSSKRVIFIGFQNISCYCLTQSHLKPIVSFPLFQNISCYCLTTKPLQSAVPRCGFQNISCYCLTFCHQLPPACFLTISKHLMLLFNSSFSFSVQFFVWFQNISCYCLTRPEGQKNALHVSFQNISCYCLTSFSRRCKKRNDISKHLMLLFNPTKNRYF